LRGYLTGILWALLAAPILAISLYALVLTQPLVQGALPTGEVIALAIDVGVAVLGYQGAVRSNLASTPSLVVLVMLLLTAGGLVGWAILTDTSPVATPEPVCNATAHPDALPCPPARNYTWGLASGALLVAVELCEAAYFVRRHKVHRAAPSARGRG
jgi:hypothetical protein